MGNSKYKFGDDMTFMEDMRIMAEEMNEMERNDFLAMAEEINRFEDELEDRKLILLSDNRKRCSNKNYPDFGDFLLRNARIKLTRLYI